MKKTILFLVTLCFISVLNAQEKVYDVEISSVSWDNRQFIKCDTIDWANFSKTHSIESDDKKIRLLTFRAGHKDSLHYIHELRYPIAPNKVRSSSLQDPRFFALSYDYKSLIFHKIHFVKEDTYLLEGINQGNQYVLIAIDIRRGIAQNADIFPLEEEKLTNLIFFSFDTLKYATKEMKAEISGERLRLPNEDDEQLAGKYIDYYFNGIHYEDSLSYASTIQQIQNGEEIITRIYFKDGDNRQIINSIYPETSYSVVVTIASKNNIYTSPVDLQLKNSDKDEHFNQPKTI